MKKNRIIALIAAAALLFSSTGCSLHKEGIFLQEDDSGYSLNESGTDNVVGGDDVSGLNGEYSDVSLDDVKEHTARLREDAEISGNSEALERDIQVLLDDLDSIARSLTYAELEYYCDWSNTELERKYDEYYETLYVASELLCYAFSNGYIKEEYASLFEPYIWAENLDYYTSRYMSEKRLEGYARVDYSVMDEYLDDYYDILKDTEKDERTKSLEAAEIYLDILSGYDAETFYDNYNRDYTGEDILTLSQAVRNELIYVDGVMGRAFWNNRYADDVFDKPMVFDNVFEEIERCAGGVSPYITEYAEKINDEHLYVIASGDNMYTGSFTETIPGEKSAVVYIYTEGDYYDLQTAIHEFGHFYSSFYDNTPSYLSQSNMDIAEIQSQGMEMLFMSAYNEIYGEQADAMRIMELWDMLYAAISGFVIGEFEYTVLKNIDTMSPEDVVDYFDELMEECGYDFKLYEISHIFESPGYYISYGVSALAALEIWEVSLTDYDRAVEMYQSIAEIPADSGEYQFREALELCGFSDVLNESYISEIRTRLIRYTQRIN